MTTVVIGYQHRQAVLVEPRTKHLVCRNFCRVFRILGPYSDVNSGSGGDRRNIPLDHDRLGRGKVSRGVGGSHYEVYKLATVGRRRIPSLNTRSLRLRIAHRQRCHTSLGNLDGIVRSVHGCGTCRIKRTGSRKLKIANATGEVLGNVEVSRLIPKRSGDGITGDYRLVVDPDHFDTAGGDQCAIPISPRRARSAVIAALIAPRPAYRRRLGRRQA